jgi:hypothetical protein
LSLNSKHLNLNHESPPAGGFSMAPKTEKTPDCPDQENFFSAMPSFEEDTAR